MRAAISAGEMTGGRIEVEGDAGDWVGGEMHGGLIQVRGRAGHLIGSAYRGSKQGMTDGTILIGGDVGDEIGSAMRRGILAVGGSCGDVAGFGMIAGSILVFGSCGIRTGAGMRRGTIGLFGPEPPKLLPTFRLAGRFRPALSFAFIAANWLASVSRSTRLLDGEMLLFHGDLVALGKGEVLDASGLSRSREQRGRPPRSSRFPLEECLPETRWH